jgi:L-seryl-tRNA(Ser) seleniumtransferase
VQESLTVVKFPRKLDDLLPPAAVTRVLDMLNQPAVSATMRDALHKVGLADANPVQQVQDAFRQARQWVTSVVDRMLEQSEASPAVVNATGQLFDPRWSSLPTDTVVVQAMAAAAVTFQDHVALEEHAERIALEVTGAPAAVLGVSMSAVCGGLLETENLPGSFVIARTDLLRIPGSTDVRALLAAGAHRVTEVGAVNGVSRNEWVEALTSNRQNLLLVSPNNLESGDAAAQRKEAIEVARDRGCRVIEVLFDGTLEQVLAERCHFPMVRASLDTGADLVLVPLDSLIGGPTGALAVGNADLVGLVRETLTTRGLRMSGAALAGAAVAMRHTQGPDRTTSSVGQLLLTSEENLKERARRLAVQLHNTARVQAAEVVETDSRLGPAPWNRYRLHGYAVALAPRDGNAEGLQMRLASGQAGAKIWTRVQGGRVLLNLRLVDPADDHLFVVALAGPTETASSSAAQPQPASETAE